MKGNIIMGKSKSKNLTDAICRDLPRLDKRYYKQGDYPGLEMWVLTSGKKTWYYQYRTKNKRYPQRKHLGNYPVVGVVEATKKAKQLSQQLFNGIDPKEQIKADIMKIQLGEAIRKYYKEELTEVNQHRAGTIKNIKAIFKVWIFRNTYDKDKLEILNRVEDIQYKKLSSITPKMFKQLFQLVGSSSPIVANRLQEYLRKFWNDYVKEPENPFLIKKKLKFDEVVYLDFLDPTELNRVMNKLVQVDDRSGRLNQDYYKKNTLNPVSCLLLAFLIATGRRTQEAASLTWDQYKVGDEPRIVLKKTKTSRRNQKLIFNLGKDAVKILNLISKDRLNNPGSKFYYEISDPRNEQIFPSRDYGKKVNGIKCKSKHIQDCGKTWDRILKLSGIQRHMKVYATRHTFATNHWRENKDSKTLAAALGTTEAIALKYAKVVGGDNVESINKIKFFEEEKPKLIQVK
jgi:integrase